VNTLPRPRPLVVIILDGWGLSPLHEGNALAVAQTPTMNTFARYFPTASLAAAGVEVGLPWGEPGNSETGHRNIGAGQIQYQILALIDKAIQDGSFFSNDVLRGAFAHVTKNQSRLHVMGLVSTGGVHAHIHHLLALIEMAHREKLRAPLFVHAITDGRDTPAQSAPFFLAQVEKALGKYKAGKIATVTGRLHAMDRNQNWHRTEAVYQMLVGQQRQAGAPSAQYAIEQAYRQNFTDETIPPTVITHGGSPLASIRNNDALIFFNYRPDRARQLAQAFGQPDFSAFSRQPLDNFYFAGMAPYERSLPVPFAFDEIAVEYPLARVLSESGLKQLHIAETEKYAHITYYLNTGQEKPFAGEDHVLIRSSAPKNFADRPHMAAGDVTDHVLKAVASDSYDVYFVNYANADMAGHTGDFQAAIRACSFVDNCLRRLYEAVVPRGGALLVTADHGNAEQMINPKTHAKDTEHTTNSVPLHYVRTQLGRSTPRSDEEVAKALYSPIGVLADVAPTALEILQLRQPASMTGVSLLNSLQ
jgi:2,3-bisphosphoglycerate-independent phosphoglycerate mutase